MLALAEKKTTTCSLKKNIAALAQKAFPLFVWKLEDCLVHSEKADSEHMVLPFAGPAHRD